MVGAAGPGKDQAHEGRVGARASREGGEDRRRHRCAAGHPRDVCVLKADVEGYEAQVLQTAEQLLAAHRVATLILVTKWSVRDGTRAAGTSASRSAKSSHARSPAARTRPGTWRPPCPTPAPLHTRPPRLPPLPPPPPLQPPQGSVSARAQTCEMLRTLRQLWALGYELHQNAFPYMTRARDPARLATGAQRPGQSPRAGCANSPGSTPGATSSSSSDGTWCAAARRAAPTSPPGEPRRRRRGARAAVATAWSADVPLPETWALAAELVDLGYRLDFLTYSANIVARRPALRVLCPCAGRLSRARRGSRRRPTRTRRRRSLPATRRAARVSLQPPCGRRRGGSGAAASPPPPPARRRRRRRRRRSPRSARQPPPSSARSMPMATASKTSRSLKPPPATCAPDLPGASRGAAAAA